MNRLEARLFLARRMRADFSAMDVDDDAHALAESDRQRIREEHRQMDADLNVRVWKLEQRVKKMRQRRNEAAQ